VPTDDSVASDAVSDPSPASELVVSVPVGTELDADDVELSTVSGGVVEGAGSLEASSSWSEVTVALVASESNEASELETDASRASPIQFARSSQLSSSTQA
jgi:hypothetical protein